MRIYSTPFFLCAGLEWNNPDILNNYSPSGSYDLNDMDNDPMPNVGNDKNHHGTRCAGEIAAVKNRYSR